MSGEIIVSDALAKMKEEIRWRREELNPKLRDEVRRTRELGDLSENDEYRSAKREWNRNNGRIRYLEAMIETAIVIGELYRHNGEWKFNAVGAGYQGGLEALCRIYGVNV